MRALACPGSLKGVLTAPDAAAALAEGLRAGGADAVELPVADGGEGTADVLRRALGGSWLGAVVTDAFGAPRDVEWLLLPDGTAVVEAAAAIPLDPSRLDPLAATSRGFGELVLAALAARPRALVVCLGGTATVDAGEGMREVLDALPVPTRALCDVRTTLWDAPRVFGPQKGASPADVAVLERRLRLQHDLVPHADVPGAGAAGGLGAALAALGAELLPGAPWVLEAIGLRGRLHAATLAVTGEGRVDATTSAGKAPAAVADAAREVGVRCVVFGGVVAEPLPGVETRALSGDPGRAAADLYELGRALAERG
ncbi:MAG TPA: glycerate kinase [Gaiellaceae bacterium]|nr:glycerate kinase [Gaiellaceae bacterium]